MELILGTDFDLGKSVKVSQVYPLTANSESTRTPLFMQKFAGIAGIGNSGNNQNGYTHPVARMFGAIRGRK